MKNRQTHVHEILPGLKCEFSSLLIDGALGDKVVYALVNFDAVWRYLFINYILP